MLHTKFPESEPSGSEEDGFEYFSIFFYASNSGRRFLNIFYFYGLNSGLTRAGPFWGPRPTITN